MAYVTDSPQGNIPAYANSPAIPEDPVRSLLARHKELSGIFEQERQQFLREADEACQRLEMRIEEVRVMRQTIRGLS
jgi:hypothetical protein